MGVGTAVLKGFDCCGCHRFVSSIQDLDLGCGHIAIVGEADPDSCFLLIQEGGGEVVADAVLRAAQDVHIAEDAGGAELILVFQVAAVAPLQDHNCQSVLAFLDVLCDVELRGGVGNFAVAQVLAVQPHVEAGVDTFEVQVSLGCVRVHRILEVSQVCAAGVFVGHIGRICREGVADVGVLVLVVAVVLPDAGNRDGIPVGSIVALLVEQVFEVVNTLTVLELPVAVQKLKAVGVLTVLYQIVHSGGSGDEVGAVGGGAYMVGMQVFIVGGNDHCAFLLKTHLLFFRSVP